MAEVDWDLENWLLEAGERVERKALAGDSLTPAEKLIREFWLFDIETRNGGVSQYFCNHGKKQWRKLVSASLPKEVPSLTPIITQVERLIAGKTDGYRATLKASPEIEDLYETHQLNVRRELRQLAPDA